MLEFGTNNDEITANCPNAPFLLSMTDNPDNELSIIIALPQRGENGQDLDISIYPQDNINSVKDILLESYPVYEDAERVYEIKFDGYIIYQCRNESYTCWDNSEIRRGRYLVIFEKSQLLDYYENVIFDIDFDDRKAKRNHYGIYTENHIIDVISNHPPVISKVESNLSK